MIAGRLPHRRPRGAVSACPPVDHMARSTPLTRLTSTVIVGCASPAIDLGRLATSRLLAALPRAPDLRMRYGEADNRTNDLPLVNAESSVENACHLKRAQELLERSEVESVGQLEQGGQRWIRVTV